MGIGELEMARPCTICTHSERLEIDRRLLRGESYRNIAEHFKLSLASISRHREAHIGTDLQDVREVMVAAREEALAQIKSEELETLETVKEEIAVEARESIAARLEACHDYFGQLRILRERAAIALETAEGAEDVKTALLAIKELRELIRVWGELDGRITSAPQINLVLNPEWQEMRLTIITALRGYPEALEAVIRAIPSQPSEERP